MWRYIGKGEYFPGIPARDLTDEEALEYGVAKLPLYRHEKEPKASEKPAKERE